METRERDQCTIGAGEDLDLARGALDSHASRGQEGEGENSPVDGSVWQRVESKMVEKEAVERKQVKEGIGMVVKALVLRELNEQQQLFFILHRTMRNACKEEKLVFKSMALVLKVMTKTMKITKITKTTKPHP